MTTIEDLAKAQLAQLQQQRAAYVEQVNQLMTAIANIDKTLAEGQALFEEKPTKKPTKKPVTASRCLAGNGCATLDQPSQSSNRPAWQSRRE